MFDISRLIYFGFALVAQRFPKGFLWNTLSRPRAFTPVRSLFGNGVNAIDRDSVFHRNPFGKRCATK
ncbi:MAG TPA: hypothetical protein ENJ95_15785 [Bacteroidetes bacterium]|nr:hypothetical protein [Bacteroidota bacterium]